MTARAAVAPSPVRRARVHQALLAAASATALSWCLAHPAAGQVTSSDPIVNTNGGAASDIDSPLASSTFGGVTYDNTRVIDQDVDKAIYTWADFSVQSDEALVFAFENASGIAFNRVQNGAPISEIHGLVRGVIEAEPNSVGDIATSRTGGNVWISNPAGVAVSSTGVFDVGGLVLTTAGLTDSAFFDVTGLDGGDAYAFVSDAGVAPDASVSNAGELNTANGVLAMVAPVVVNTDGADIRSNANGNTPGATAGEVILAGARSFDIQFLAGADASRNNLDLFAFRITEGTNAGGTVVDQSGSIGVTNAGAPAFVALTAAAKDGVIDQVIAAPGMTRARGARENGTSVLLFGAGDTGGGAVDVYANADPIDAGAFDAIDGAAVNVRVRGDVGDSEPLLQALANSAADPEQGGDIVLAGRRVTVGSTQAGAPETVITSERDDLIINAARSATVNAVSFLNTNGNPVVGARATALEVRGNEVAINTDLAADTITLEQRTNGGQLTVDGDLTATDGAVDIMAGTASVQNVTASGPVSITATRDAIINGAVESGGDTTVLAGRQIQLPGVGRVDAGANTVTLRSGSTQDFADAVVDDGNLRINARVAGRVIGGDVVIEAARGNLNLAGDGAVVAADTADLRAGRNLIINDSGLAPSTVLSLETQTGDVSLDAAPSLDGSLTVDAGGDVTIAGPLLVNVDNAVTPGEAESLSIVAGGVITSGADNIRAIGAADVTLDAGGSLASSATPVLTFGEVFGRDVTLIARAGDLTAGADVIARRDGRFEAAGALTVDTAPGRNLDASAETGDLAVLVDLVGLDAVTLNGGGPLVVTQNIAVNETVAISGAQTVVINGTDVRADSAITVEAGNSLLAPLASFDAPSVALAAGLSETGDQTLTFANVLANDLSLVNRAGTVDLSTIQARLNPADPADRFGDLTLQTRDALTLPTIIVDGALSAASTDGGVTSLVPATPSDFTGQTVSVTAEQDIALNAVTATGGGGAPGASDPELVVTSNAGAVTLNAVSVTDGSGEVSANGLLDVTSAAISTTGAPGVGEALEGLTLTSVAGDVALDTITSKDANVTVQAQNGSVTIADAASFDQTGAVDLTFMVDALTGGVDLGEAIAGFTLELLNNAQNLEFDVTADGDATLVFEGDVEIDTLEAASVDLTVLALDTGDPGTSEAGDLTANVIRATSGDAAVDVAGAIDVMLIEAIGGAVQAQSAGALLVDMAMGVGVSLTSANADVDANVVDAMTGSANLFSAAGASVVSVSGEDVFVQATSGAVDVGAATAANSVSLNANGAGGSVTVDTIDAGRFGDVFSSGDITIGALTAADSIVNAADGDIAVTSATVTRGAEASDGDLSITAATGRVDATRLEANGGRIDVDGEAGVSVGSIAMTAAPGEGDSAELISGSGAVVLGEVGGASSTLTNANLILSGAAGAHILATVAQAVAGAMAGDPLPADSLSISVTATGADADASIEADVTQTVGSGVGSITVSGARNADVRDGDAGVAIAQEALDGGSFTFNVTAGVAARVIETGDAILSSVTGGRVAVTAQGGDVILDTATATGVDEVTPGQGVVAQDLLVTSDDGAVSVTTATVTGGAFFDAATGVVVDQVNALGTADSGDLVRLRATGAGADVVLDGATLADADLALNAAQDAQITGPVDQTASGARDAFIQVAAGRNALVEANVSQSVGSGAGAITVSGDGDVIVASAADIAVTQTSGAGGSSTFDVSAGAQALVRETGGVALTSIEAQTVDVTAVTGDAVVGQATATGVDGAASDLSIISEAGAANVADAVVTGDGLIQGATGVSVTTLTATGPGLVTLRSTGLTADVTLAGGDVTDADLTLEAGRDAVIAGETTQRGQADTPVTTTLTAGRDALVQATLTQRVEDADGSIILDAAANARVGEAGAPVDVIQTSSGDGALALNVLAGLEASVSEVGGAIVSLISGATVDVRSQTANVRVDEAAATAGAVTLTAQNNLTVGAATGASITADAVSGRLEAATLTATAGDSAATAEGSAVVGSIGASGAATVDAATGNATVGSASGSSVSVTAGGSASLGDATAGGDLLVRGGTDAAVTGSATGGVVTVDAQGGDATVGEVTATGGAVEVSATGAAGVGAASGQSVAVTGQTVEADDIEASAGDASLIAVEAADVGVVDAAGAVTIQAGTDAMVGTSSAGATGASVLIEAQTGSATVNEAASTTGDIVILAGDDVLVRRTVSAGDQLGINAGGALTVNNGGALQAGRVLDETGAPSIAIVAQTLGLPGRIEAGGGAVWIAANNTGDSFGVALGDLTPDIDLKIINDEFSRITAAALNIYAEPVSVAADMGALVADDPAPAIVGGENPGVTVGNLELSGDRTPIVRLLANGAPFPVRTDADVLEAGGKVRIFRSVTQAEGAAPAQLEVGDVVDPAGWRPGLVWVSGNVGDANVSGTPDAPIGAFRAAGGDILFGSEAFVDAFQRDPENFRAEQFGVLNANDVWLAAESAELAASGRVFSENTVPQVGGGLVLFPADRVFDPAIFESFDPALSVDAQEIAVFAEARPGGGEIVQGQGVALIPGILGDTLPPSPAYRINGCVVGEVGNCTALFDTLVLPRFEDIVDTLTIETDDDDDSAGEIRATGSGAEDTWGL